MSSVDVGSGSGDRSARDAGGRAGATLDAINSALFPCSYTQKRIWYAQQVDPEGSHWNVAMRWRLEGRLRDATVEQAFQLLVDRHEALRTTIEEIDGVPHQRVWQHFPFKLGTIDMSRLPSEQRLAAVDQIARNDARKLLPLDERPPLRLQLIRLDDETAILLTNFHNIIVDGWSVGVLMREFGEIASRLESGRDPDLPEPSMQHVDYTLWQEDMIASGSFEDDKKYWAARLTDWKRFEVPSDKPRPHVQTHEGDIRTLVLPPHLSSTLESFAREHGCSMFHIGAAMLSAVLSKAAGNSDVILGTQTACRDEPELETMVGPLINTAVLRFDVSGDPLLLNLLKHCRARATEAMAHQHLPFNFVVEALKPNRDPSRSLIYSATFTAQAAHIDSGQRGDLRFAGLTIAALPSFSAGAPTDLFFFMVGREEGWRLSCAGNTDLFEIGTIDGLLEQWAQALEVLVKHGGAARLSQLREKATGRYAATSIGGAAQAEKAEDLAPAAIASVEQRVAGIWKDVLETDAITGDTDFFDAGGTSLLALRMLSRLNKAFNKSFALTALLRHPVLREFAKEVDAALTSRPTMNTTAPAVSPQTSAKARPRKVLALNNGSAYRMVERALGSSYSIVDVEVGTEADLEFARTHSFPEVVARVVDRIIATDPTGPYVIMAYCALGPVAYEAVRQLSASGRQVDLLVMLNAVAPHYNADLSAKARRLRRIVQAREAVENFRLLLGMRRRGEITTGVLIENYSVLRRLKVADLLRRLGVIDATPAPKDLGTLLEYPSVLKRLLNDGPRLSGKAQCDVAVFRSSDWPRGPAFPSALGWSNWVSGQVRVYDVEGKHIELLRDPAASAIGKQLTMLLDSLENSERRAVTN